MGKVSTRLIRSVTLILLTIYIITALLNGSTPIGLALWVMLGTALLGGVSMAVFFWQQGHNYDMALTIACYIDCFILLLYPLYLLNNPWWQWIGFGTGFGIWAGFSIICIILDARENRTLQQIYLQELLYEEDWDEEDDYDEMEK